MINNITDATPKPRDDDPLVVVVSGVVGASVFMASGVGIITVEVPVTGGAGLVLETVVIASVVV